MLIPHILIYTFEGGGKLFKEHKKGRGLKNTAQAIYNLI